MPLHLRTKVPASLLLCALVCPWPPPRAQDGAQTHTRPRRVGTHTPEKTSDDSNPSDDRLPAAADWRSSAGAEPTIRVGLVTDARAVTISTGGTLLRSSVSGAGAAPLGVSRLRVEPRAAPAPPQMPGGEEAKAPAPSKEGGPSKEAASSRDAARPSSPPKKTTAGGGGASAHGLRLTSRAAAPARSLVGYAEATRPLVESREPVVFASADEARQPVRVNEKPYRGRVEVFVNARGTLSVVNVVALEDYLRGVVPNELSPGAFPELEALKAQAVAARTYAVANRGKFAAEGFDLLPTARSQVYGGRATEQPLTDRAVAETRGRVATYDGRPVNALYTSTCGGHTEHAEEIFGGDPVPYLRGRACAAPADDPTRGRLRTTRDAPALRDAAHAPSARDAALLSTHGLRLPARLSDEWLAAPLTSEDAGLLLSFAASAARRAPPNVSADATRPPGFSTALAHALDGESRGRVLLGEPDVEYFLSFRDADDVPAANRADVAQLIREGALPLLPDATLRPRQPLSRARALRTLAGVLEARGLLRLQRASVRAHAGGALTLRPAPKGPDRQLKVARGAHLFRAFGPQLFAVREVAIAGGEAVVFHEDAGGEIDYLEVAPAPAGAAADRASAFSTWTVALAPAELLARLDRSAADVGELVDLRVVRRGESGRVLDLEVVGTEGTAHVRGGRVRTALALREQLFVIDRSFDEAGRPVRFTFRGRGWGHGVGMCQVGAYGLARAGETYEEILKAYYTGITLTRLY